MIKKVLSPKKKLNVGELPKIRIQDIFLKNLWMKFLSILISLIIWLIVLNSKTISETVDVPLTFNKPADVVILKDVPEKVSVRFSGSKAFLRNVLNRDHTIEIDLSSFKEGTSRVRVPFEQISLPRNVSITRVTPSQFDVILDKRLEKIVPVQLTTTGELPGDEIIRTVEIEPNEITISGPESLVKKINVIKTDAVDLSQIKGSIVHELGLTIPDAKLVAASATRTKVNFDVEGGISNIFRLKNIPIVKVGRKRIFPSVVTVVVRTSLSKISTSLVNRIKVVADVKRLPDSFKGKVSLDITLPEGLSLVRIEPSEVQVR